MNPNISSAEWEVMDVLWGKAPLTATEVFEALPDGHGWKPKTVGTFLTRLVGKGVLAIDKSQRPFRYRPRVAREACVAQESDSFLQRVFRGATGPLLAHFCEKAD